MYCAQICEFSIISTTPHMPRDMPSQNFGAKELGKATPKHGQPRTKNHELPKAWVVVHEHSCYGSFFLQQNAICLFSATKNLHEEESFFLKCVFGQQVSLWLFRNLDLHIADAWHRGLCWDPVDQPSVRNVPRTVVAQVVESTLVGYYLLVIAHMAGWNISKIWKTINHWWIIHCEVLVDQRV